MGGFDQAMVGFVGAGEGAFFMSEEFGFDQVFRDSGAVYGDQRGLFARALFVHSPGDQLLAGAGLTEDKYGGIGGGDAGDAAEDLVHGGAGTDHPADRIASREIGF